MDCLRGSQTSLPHFANKQIRVSGTFSFILFSSVVYLFTNYHINNIRNHIYKIHQNSRLRPFLIDFIYHKYVHFSSTLYPSFLLHVLKGERRLMEVSMACFLLQLETTNPLHTHIIKMFLPQDYISY